DPIDRIADVKLQVGRHLVIAASPRVELATDVAKTSNERRLDVHVDVFELRLELELTGSDVAGDFVKTCDELISLGLANQSDRGEHRGVCLRTGDVERCE